MNHSKMIERMLFYTVIATATIGMTATIANAVGTETPATTNSAFDVASELRRANSSIAAGNHDIALIILTKIVKRDVRNADAYNLLGFSSRKLNRLDDAERYYNRALDIAPQHVGALEYQGELFLRLKLPEKANANLAMLLEICGADCHEYLDLKHDIERYELGENSSKFIRAPAG